MADLVSFLCTESRLLQELIADGSDEALPGDVNSLSLLFSVPPAKLLLLESLLPYTPRDAKDHYQQPPLFELFTRLAFPSLCRLAPDEACTLLQLIDQLLLPKTLLHTVAYSVLQCCMISAGAIIIEAGAPAGLQRHAFSASWRGHVSSCGHCGPAVDDAWLHWRGRASPWLKLKLASIAGLYYPPVDICGSTAASAIISAVAPAAATASRRHEEARADGTTSVPATEDAADTEWRWRDSLLQDQAPRVQLTCGLLPILSASESAEDLVEAPLRSRPAAAHVAALGGQLALLRELHSREPACFTDRWAVAFAAKGGHAEVLRWLADPEVGALERPAAHAFACAYAAGGGHLEVLRWLRDQGCPWDDATCVYAAAGGHLQTLRWLRASGCPWDCERCARAAAAAPGNPTAAWIAAAAALEDAAAEEAGSSDGEAEEE